MRKDSCIVVWLGVFLLMASGCSQSNSTSTATIHFEVVHHLASSGPSPKDQKFLDVARSPSFLQAIAVKYQTAFNEPDPHKITGRLFGQLVVTQDQAEPSVFYLEVTDKSKVMSYALMQVWLKELDRYFDDANEIDPNPRLWKTQMDELTKRLNEHAKRMPKQGAGEESKEMAEWNEERNAIRNEREKLIVENDSSHIDAFRVNRQYKLDILQLPQGLKISKSEADEYQALRSRCPSLPILKYEILLD